MEQKALQIKERVQAFIKYIGQYLSWFITRANDYIKQRVGEENYQKIQQFFQKHAFACIFGSMVVGACLFHLRYRKRISKQSIESSDHSRSKKSTSQRLPDKVKNKFKFVSSDDQNGHKRRPEHFPTENYESTKQSKRDRKRTVPLIKQRFLQQNEIQEVLQKQCKKAQKDKVVLDDSNSDKIFNEMYGMYQQALRREP